MRDQLVSHFHLFRLLFVPLIDLYEKKEPVADEPAVLH